ncbi:unnamed protein product, partial [Rotaria sp. Silwood2]
PSYQPPPPPVPWQSSLPPPPPVQQQCMQQPAAAARCRGGIFDANRNNESSFYNATPAYTPEYGAAAAGIPPPFPITTTISPSSFYYPDQTPITNSTAGRGKI